MESRGVSISQWQGSQDLSKFCKQCMQGSQSGGTQRLDRWTHEKVAVFITITLCQVDFICCNKILLVIMIDRRGVCVYDHRGEK